MSDAVFRPLSARRILALWLPRLASERVLRRAPVPGPFAVTEVQAGAERLVCVSQAAAAAGLRAGMALAEARAFCPQLITHRNNARAVALLLGALRRWALRYCPWVAVDGTDGLVLDISGAAHLMAGEAALLDDLTARLGHMGFAARAGLADTRGAAWALARFGGRDVMPAGGYTIAPPGTLPDAIGPLPLAGLRLESETLVALERLGLRVIRDLAALPRASLARRFGQEVVLRLDQALGVVPEPVSPAAEPPHFGVRLSFPDPIGLRGDIEAGLMRLLDRLCDRLHAADRGARRLRLEIARADGSRAEAEIGLARPMRRPDDMAALFFRALDDIDAGFGIDMLRLTAPLTEHLPAEQVTTTGQTRADALADLLTRLGNRVGFERLIRFLPADSHIPERSFVVASAAHAEPSTGWPDGLLRPLLLFTPEPLSCPPDLPTPPPRFVWRRRSFRVLAVQGPERITAEWWLDDPAWRSGLRDYWRVETHEGPRLWLFHTPQTGGWAVQGVFA